MAATHMGGDDGVVVLVQSNYNGTVRARGNHFREKKEVILPAVGLGDGLRFRWVWDDVSKHR